MHYHVVVMDAGQPDRELTFDTWSEAEEEAEAISREHDGWVPQRYPGRSCRPGEVAVYLDRRVVERRVTDRELVVIRCAADDREPQPADNCLDEPPPDRY